MRALVTGAGGFLGGHLCAALLERGHAVCAMDRPGAPAVAGAEQLPADLHDPQAMTAAVAAARPDWVFHLAAQSFPGRSWAEPAETCRTNIVGTIHLLDAVRTAAAGARVVVAGSSSEYAPSAEPIAEDAPMTPASPYAISKLATDQVTSLYAARYGLAAMRVRPFFLLGPGKTGDVSSDLARGIVGIERGQATELAVGNLNAVRDFLDCRDGVAAFIAVAERGVAGTAYNVCSGHGCAIRELLNLFKAAAKGPIAERVDVARLRPLDEPVKVGDNRRLRALGWTPRVPLEQSVRDILEYWRCR